MIQPARRIGVTAATALVLISTALSSPHVNDLWELDPETGSWTQLTPDGPSPEPRRFFPHAYDSLRDRMIVAGGEGNGPTIYLDTWALDLGDEGPTWTLLSSDNPSSFFIFRGGLYDPLRDRFVVLGFSTQVYVLDLATNTWTTEFPTNPPSDSLRFTTHSVTYDSVNDQYVIFGGGVGSLPSGYSNRIRTLDPDTFEWTVIEIPPANPQPTARSLAATVFDHSTARMILFGGAQPGGFGSGTSLADTWRMTLTSGIEAWTELSPATSPPDRAQHDVTYDTVREQMFIHGGLQYASDEFYALDDAWVFGGANWSQAGTNQPRPVRRRGAGAVYDMDDDRHILFAGEIFPNRPPPNPVMVLASDMKFVPRSLNLTSQGQWVGCHIPAPEGYEATDINIPSLRLNGVVSPDGPISFEDTDGDGTVDLVVKFPRADVIATLEQITASTEIIVTGDVGSDEFQATDVIRTLWVGNQAVAPGFTLDLEMSLDAAMPDEKLHYSIHGAPAGVTFDAHTGQFRWSPNQSDAGKTYLVTFAVHEAEFALSESIVIRVNGTVPATLTRLTAD